MADTKTVDTHSVQMKDHVLVVDDQVAIRTAVTDILAMEGYNVLEASTGVEALQIFAEHSHQIGLVLLDSQMPVMDGAETLKRLLPLAPDIRVIISSGYGQDTLADLSKLGSEGQVTFLPKPYDAIALLDAVAMAFGPDAH